MSEKILGPLSVIGAAIGYTLASFPHSWGALGSYMISYHAHYTPDLDTSVFEWIYPTQLIGEASSFIIAPIISNYLSNRTISLLMSVLLALSLGQTYLTYYSLLSCFTFAYFSGFASGVIQIACIYPPTSYYPHSIGKLSGLLNGTFTLGFGAFGILYKALCNPDNLKLNPQSMTYPKEVIENYPMLLITTMIVIILFGLITFLLLSQNKISIETKGEASVYQVAKTSQFWIAFGLTFTLFHSNLFAFSNYKVIGMKFINDDALVTNAQTICVLGNFVGRFVWGTVCQKFGFKRVSIVILCLLTVIFVLIPINFGGYYWYTILGAVWFFLCSVSYPGLLVFCNMKYGLKLSSSVYGYLLLATAITTINIGFIKCIAPVIGYSGIFYVIGGIFVLGLVFNLQLSEKPYKYSRKTTLTSLI